MQSRGGGLAGWRSLHRSLRLGPALAPQILTRDSVTTQVDGVVYYRIYSAVSAVANVHDVHQATFLLAQTTLRNVLGTQTLSQILSGREEIAHSIQVRTARTKSWRFRSVPGSVVTNEWSQTPPYMFSLSLNLSLSLLSFA